MIESYEITKEYESQKNGEEQIGEIIISVSIDDKMYDVLFEFVRRGTAPSEHTIFPTGAESEIYAWPKNKIPDYLTVDIGTDKALDTVFSVPPEINLLDKEYKNAESTDNPFINDPNR